MSAEAEKNTAVANTTDKQASPCDPEGEDLMNPATFSPPTLTVGPNVFIEYCDRVSLRL